jgi:hypothetical protein
MLGNRRRTFDLRSSRLQVSSPQIHLRTEQSKEDLGPAPVMTTTTFKSRPVLETQRNSPDSLPGRKHSVIKDSDRLIIIRTHQINHLASPSNISTKRRRPMNQALKVKKSWFIPTPAQKQNFTTNSQDSLETISIEQRPVI